MFVGSSKTKIFGFDKIALAKVTDCLSPPDKPSPLSPTTKSYPDSCFPRNS